MLKRTLISGMWFVALWSVGGAMSVYLGVPRPAMLLPVAACSIAVWFGLAMYDQWRAAHVVQSEVTSRTRLAHHVARNLTPDLEA